jgi:hypothetical protein
MLLIGIPAISLLNYYGATKWWQVTLAGTPVPALITWNDGAGTALVFGLCGALVALASWFIAFYRLPDDDSGKPAD